MKPPKSKTSSSKLPEGAFSDSDTQLLWLIYANPTRNTGRFASASKAEAHSGMWHTTPSTAAKFPSPQETHFALIGIYGDDSDYVRIRILGHSPARA